MDWLTFMWLGIMAIPVIGIVALCLLSKWIERDYTSEPLTNVPTLAEIHAEQHRLWDEEFEALLPISERKPRNEYEELERQLDTPLRAINFNLYRDMLEYQALGNYEMAAYCHRKLLARAAVLKKNKSFGGNKHEL